MSEAGVTWGQLLPVLRSAIAVLHSTGTVVAGTAVRRLLVRLAVNVWGDWDVCSPGGVVEVLNGLEEDVALELLLVEALHKEAERPVMTIIPRLPPHGWSK